jgi:hypothetical protein
MYKYGALIIYWELDLGRELLAVKHNQTNNITRVKFLLEDFFTRPLNIRLAKLELILQLVQNTTDAKQN